MKIAQVAPLHETVPPAGYGGTERVVSWLCEALVGLGHEVTLFASAGSATRARLVAFRDQPLRTDPDLCFEHIDHALMIDKVREAADEFDVIHFHTDFLHMLRFGDMAAKTLTTLHGRLDIKGMPEFFDHFQEFPLVSISDHQRAAAPGANYAGTVYHGLPLSTYTPDDRTDQDYVAFLGRFSPEKGADKAVDIARRSGLNIRLAAKICRQNHVNQTYYNDVMQPLLGLPGVEYVGEIGDREKNAFLGGAKAVLFPISWPEPFGLVMIEAMACGTPVVAFDCGSVPEVIEDGVTGFIVRSQDEAVEALKKIDTLDRRKIRERFEKRFSSVVMAQSYCRLYERQIGTAAATAGLHWRAAAPLEKAWGM
jgi:glycosyltransferase involved in cell wall biosynthesis